MIKIHDILFEKINKYYYHATLPENLPNIVNNGLIPSNNSNWGGNLGKESIGKVFVTNNFETANYYGNILWRNYPNRYKPILRFIKSKTKLFPDKHSENDFYSEYPIKEKFEIFVYDENTKFIKDKNGNVWFNEHNGYWQPLTYEIATAIAYGEWDDWEENEEN